MRYNHRMRASLLYTIFFAALFLAACSGKSVSTDYDPDFPVTSLHTFSVIEENAAADPLDAQRTEEAVTAVFESKGYRRVAENGDFEVRCRLRLLRDVPSNVSIGFGFGGGSRNMGISMGTAKTLTHDEIHLRIVAVDPKKRRVFWEAEAGDDFDFDAPPAVKTDAVRRLVATMLKSFPKARS